MRHTPQGRRVKEKEGERGRDGRAEGKSERAGDKGREKEKDSSGGPSKETSPLNRGKSKHV